MASEQFLHDKLEERRAQHLLRSLALPTGLTDFSSNDYLGLSHSGKLWRAAEAFVRETGQHASGATGSRLISGNSAYTEAVERQIAEFHQAEAALIFNSGYSANVGLLACIAQKGDTYLSDELCHASLIDGMRLSHAQRIRFKHNDLGDLEKKLQRAQGNAFVVVESIYSMDGDAAPLQEMARLCEAHQAHLIVDEAHGIGIFGEKGGGLCMALGVHNQIFARIYTYGKAPGCHGAAIVGSEALRSYLINFSRAFIYTTALPFHAVATIACAYRLLSEATTERSQLQRLIAHFRAWASEAPHIETSPSHSAIQTIIVPGNEAVLNVSAKLVKAGLEAKAIRYPTVAAGSERIRICLHAFNTEAEIDRLWEAILNAR